MDTVHELEALLEKAKAAAVNLENKVTGQVQPPAPTAPAATQTAEPAKPVILPAIAAAPRLAPPKPVAPAPASAPATPAAKPARPARPTVKKTIVVGGQTYAADGLTQEWKPRK